MDLDMSDPSDALAIAALDPQHTDRIFIRHRSIFPHICSTWLSYEAPPVSKIAAFARILPFAPYLTEYAESLFSREDFPKLLDIRAGELDEISVDDLREHLLGVFRLLVFDNATFARTLQPAILPFLISHSDSSIRYLSVRVFCLYLHAADDARSKMIARYVGNNAFSGLWEGCAIDYTFLSLWEEQRNKSLVASLQNASMEDTGPQRMGSTSTRERDECCDIYGIQLPRLIGPPTTKSGNWVPTNTAISNLTATAQALLTSNAILLTGLPGAGKTLTIKHLATQLNKLDTMITLHLNEQSDAKLLIGMYTTGSDPGSFSWQPGVLTTAVREGRWVFIEDLDRAPNEILSNFLPLIERGELIIPSRGERIIAAPGFKIVATMRTTQTLKGDEIPIKSLLGARFWHSVHMKSLPPTELEMIIAAKFPTLQRHLPAIMNTYLRITSEKLAVSKSDQLTRSRVVTPRDLMKWCRRLSSLLRNESRLTSEEKDGIFLEAFDSFAGSFRDLDSRLNVMSRVAEELHLDPQRRDHLITGREIHHRVSGNSFQIGRVTLTRQIGTKSRDSRSKRPFSTNAHTLRLMERFGRAVDCKEPLLLVGETGTGKTTCIQFLADQLGKKLFAFNLSQQSESSDLLGGFKPVSVRSLVIPMKDEFDELFEATFSMRKNQKFVDLLGKRAAKGDWRRICALWREALKMVAAHRASQDGSNGQQPAKKRKLNTTPFPAVRWEKFEFDLTVLESRLARKSEAFAFAFQEGNIVKAVRNGDWVLLDEINLASPDTLEALADLFEFDGEPSLMLTETGSTKRIIAHPDFRIFAAMNPATDVGKKDLPPGIRSRFTELYVDSPDTDIKSLQNVVETYLGSDMPESKRIAADVTALYLHIQDLVKRNTLVDGAAQKPHFSLRTLTRTLTYARDMAGLCSLRRALYEGFHMSFCTFLNSASESLISPVIQEHLFGQHTNVRSEMKKTLQCPSDGAKYVREGHHWLRQGISPVEDQSHYIITPFVQRNLNNLIRASSTRRYPVLIQGPTSSGKTSMIEYLAKRTGNRFVRINNHEHTDLQEYLGTYVSADGVLRFQDGILVQALREGHWIVLDELNLAPTDVLEALNRLLDDNRELLIPETQEVIRPHENFMLFATQNPAGLYGGRKVLSRAFRNRFLELHFDDIPVDELTEILHKRTLIPESWCKRIVSVYKELSLLRQEERIFEQKSFATLRDLFRWALRKAETVQDLAENGFMLLAERVRKEEERSSVKQIIERVMSKNGPRISIEVTNLYATVGKNANDEATRQIIDASGIAWNSSMRRLYKLVSEALRNNEPVLLVGETGCGKTTVCQLLAEAHKKELHILNAHQNTETGDIIGSQRPVRNRAASEEALFRLLEQALQADAAAHGLTLDALVVRFDSLPPEQLELIPTEMQAEIATLRSKIKTLFEWVDGSLVYAMKNEQYFLLDEISLADDSVLERLNSVLESQRTLLLAEKGTQDAIVQADAEFQFMATMNPGGDYGKKELSPALRNRFTEIWVPPLSKTDDIIQIVREKLSSDHVQYAEAMVAFAQWFSQRYATSHSSTISVRDMLSWVAFVNDANLPAVSAVVHGAAMVYVDTLGANPSALLALSSDVILAERAACFEQLSMQFRERIEESFFDFRFRNTKGSLVFGEFEVAKTDHAEVDSSFGFTASTTRKNAMRIVRALQSSKPILIEGNPGVGKTTLVVALARSVGVPLTRINLSEQTDVIDLFGSDVPVEGEQAGRFAWQDAPFLKAMKNGEWVLLDEMNLASQSILEGLNACLDHRGTVYISELDQTFHRHPNFRLFAAQNPHSQGGGRKGLPASFVNRFSVVYADVFTADDLLLICKKLFPAIDDEETAKLINFVSSLDTAVTHGRHFGAQGSPWEFNLRDTLRWLKLISKTEGLIATGTARDSLDTVFTLRFRNVPDRQETSALFRNAYGNRSAEDRSFYHNLDSKNFQVGLASLKRDSLSGGLSVRGGSYLLSKHHLPIVESFMIAIGENWPIILVGPPQSGKSFIINYVSAVCGAKVVTFPMSADVDAMDLVGGYEQVDHSRQVNQFFSRVKDFIDRFIISNFVNQSFESSVLQVLLQLRIAAISESFPSVCEGLRSLLVSIKVDEVVLLLEEARAVEKAYVADEGPRFQWIDGILVEAIEKGNWLVLDNANFASSSVLDRLNSLLEPNGYLMVNEHMTEDGEARIVRPHQDFRIIFTMDPRNGELSRAMRNRAVELCLLSDNTDAVQPIPTSSFILDSDMYRFRHIIDSLLQPDASGSNLNVASDHLSIEDFDLFDSFRSQVNVGLLSPQNDHDSKTTTSQESGESRAEMNLWSSPIATRKLQGSSCMWNLDPSLLSLLILRSQHCYRQIVPGIFPVEAINTQSIHPMNNELILRQSPDVELNGKTFQLLLQTTQYAIEMKSAFESLPIKQRHGASKAAAKTLRGFLQKVSFATRELLEQTFIPFQMVIQIYQAWMTLCEEFTNDRLDMARINVTVAILRNILAKSVEISKDFQNVVMEGLAIFSSASRLTTGQSMERIWKIFRPPIPTSEELLGHLLKLEHVAREFDELVWQSNQTYEELCRMRFTLSKAMQICLENDVNPTGLIEGISTFIQDLKSKTDGATTRPNSPFEGFFYFLSQVFSIYQEKTLDSVLAQKASLLSRRPTTSQYSNSSISGGLRQLVEYADNARGTFEIPALSAKSYFVMLGKLNDVEKTPLSSMSYVRLELETISQTLANENSLLIRSQVDALDEKLSSIAQALHGAHAEVIEQSSIHTGEEDWEIYYTLRDCLRNVQQFLAREQNDTENDMRSAGEIWIQLGLEALKLYVPSNAFDPALKPTIQREWFFRQQKELHQALTGLKTFEAGFSGSESSLRIQHVEQQLRDLGTEPASALVIRPTRSEVEQLQGDFNNLLSVILPIAKNMEDIANDSNVTLARNLAQISERLTSGYRHYTDLTAPVVGFLACLKIGFALLRSSAVDATNQDCIDAHLLSNTPFAGHQFKPLSADSMPLQPPSKDPRRIEHILGVCLLDSTVDHHWYQSTAIWDRFEELFAEAYTTWKEVLRVEQEKAAADSSLYQYRDKTASGEQEEEEDLSLFPDYERESADAEPEKAVENVTRTSPRVLAITLARAHNELLSGCITSSSAIRRIIEGTISAIGQSPDTGDTVLHSSKPSTILPLLLVKLESSLDQLNGSRLASKDYNFYFDENITESKRYQNTVSRVRDRFRIIQKTWPEHATLAEVIHHCDEASAFRFVEPLAKLLTKAEKIQSIVNEWQKLASREFSAASFYDELTSLIVSWRQLELNSWAKLFDKEVEKSVEDARSWWFIAYETVIVATRSLDISTDSVRVFAQSLLSTLETYMHSTSLGQYSPRLGLLRQLQQHLEHTPEPNEATTAVRNALSNFIDFYGLFEQPVQDLIQTLRKPLEKDINNTIRLASWKDTNIDALRQSAKQSHRKLTKVVRKFREVLRRPASSVMDGEILSVTVDSSSGVAFQGVNVINDAAAADLCSQAVPDWDNRPARFRNLATTIRLMQSKEHGLANASTVCDYLDSFLRNIETSSARLRKETPVTLTKENTDTVKHLKAQKRRLLVDTLKEIRLMGLQSNVGGDILSRQSSMSTVLASMLSYAPTFAATMQSSSLNLHKALQIMSKIRELGKEHSGDITPSEVARGINYLESMLHMSIRQRNAISRSSAVFVQLDATLDRVRSLWKSDQYEVRKIKHGIDLAPSQLLKHLRWLSALLQTAQWLVDIQRRIGSADVSKVIDALAVLDQRATSLIKSIQESPELPIELTSTAHAAIQSDTREYLAEARKSLDALLNSYPNVKIVLDHVVPWTSLNALLVETNWASVSSVTQLSSAKNMLFEAVDAVLGSVQDIESSIVSIPTSTDDAGWLIKHDQVFTNSLGNLHLSLILERIIQVSEVAHTVSVDEAGGRSPVMAFAGMLASILPILDQYRNTCLSVITQYVKLHAVTTKMLYQLGNVFTRVGVQGFCTPPEKSDEKSAKDDKLEAGTGLGEGDGAEDISKDIADDEDLSELAQQPDNKTDKEDIEEEKDAVDMADQEMEGEMGDVDDKADDEEQTSDQDNDDMEEDVGDVDDLGPSTVDEKMWDEGGNENDKEQEGSDGKGVENKEEQVAAGDEKQNEDNKKEQEANDDDAEIEAGNEETEDGGQQEQVEQQDPHMDESEKLDLPDDLNMDDQKSVASSDGLGDLDDMDDAKDDELMDEPGANETDDHEEGSLDAEDAAGNSVDADGEDQASDEEDNSDVDFQGTDEEQEPQMQDENSEPHGLEDKSNEHAAPDMSADVGAGEEAMDANDQKQQPSTGAAKQEEGAQGDDTENQNQKSSELGTEQQKDTQDGVGRGDESEDSAETQAFKKVGDAIERWYKQQREILNPQSNDKDQQRREKDVDMADADFEHLPDDEAQADAQALGTASEEQAKALDDDLALPSNEAEHKEENDKYAMDVDDAEDSGQTEQKLPETKEANSGPQGDKDTDGRPTTFIGGTNKDTSGDDEDVPMEDADSEPSTPDLEPIETQLSETHLTPSNATEARALWATHSSRTLTLTQSLTEHLRLILNPTHATALRGSFRTGKRLNMKRIIPYIASSYKRDKIWLRRTQPSKRSYQIMLAVDDSESMAASGAVDLAFDSLVMVSGALNMLEAGELCVVGFGEGVNVVHPFDKTWSSEAGAEVLGRFTFQQNRTDVRKLIHASTGLFQDARLRASSSASELWQLQIIISDGVCDSHEEIKRLVRRAQEERIMIVFVIVDSATSGEEGRKKDSILDLQSVDITPEGKVQRWRYMDQFPFRWYIVVRDVAELPGVLSMALRQWFSEVVSSG